ncbi:MAG TPA: helix-turn-helix domain-containing protein [Polyangiaceae bacterium]|nr:helix-turn-helix domain-containing protein [Polyangiaceae bacterium]
MLFHELMTAKREEILQACRAELAHPEGLDQLAQYVTTFFDEIVQLLDPNERGSAPASRPTVPAMPNARLVGTSAAMTQVRSAIERLAYRCRASVLIVGEAGTGRRHCARALHFATFPEGEFFELSTAAQLPELEHRIAAQRLGQARAPSSGLTVYVRELLDSPASIRDRLTGLKREPDLPVRVIASSKRSLTSGAARERLQSESAASFAKELILPPLVERGSDVLDLARHFARVASAKNGAPLLRFSAAAIARLQSHSWPGNVAELAALVERLARTSNVVVQDRDLYELDLQPAVAFTLPATGIDLTALERDLLTQALDLAENDHNRAASLLNLTRDQLRYRLAKLGLVARSLRSG